MSRAADPSSTSPSLRWGAGSSRRRRSPVVRRLSVAVLLVLGLFAVLGPLVWTDPVSQDLARYLERPSWSDPLGRDHLGRSVLARLAHATRLSLLLAIACVATAAVVGTLTGIVAAWRGRWVDAALSGLSEALIALPTLLIVLVVSAMADGDLMLVYGGLAAAQWVEYFRVVRARSGLILAAPAVEAARLLRLGPLHVARRHLWPELRSLLATMATFGIATCVLALSTLGFVGVGVRPPTPELGLMITEAFPHYDEAPWLSVAPVVFLAATLTSLLGLRARGGRS